MLVITDYFLRFAWSLSCFYGSCWALSITITGVEWTWNFEVPKGTGFVPFLYASENWNTSISNWRSPDRSWSVWQKYENEIKEGTEGWNSSSQVTQPTYNLLDLPIKCGFYHSFTKIKFGFPYIKFHFQKSK